MFVSSCSRKGGVDVKTLDLATSVRPYGDADKAGNLFEVISFTDVSAQDESVLSDMGQTVFYIDDTHFGLVDSQLNGAKRIFRVDETTGEAELVISRTGRGPGEYLSVTGIEYRDGNYHFADEMSGKSLIYDAQGKLVEEKKIDKNKNIREIGDGVVAVGNLYGSDTDLDIFSPDGTLLKSYKLSPSDVKTRFAYLQAVAKMNNDYFFRPSISDTLYRVSAEAVAPYLVLQADKYKMPLKLYSTLDDNAKSSYMDNVSCNIYGDYAFCDYYFDGKLYRTLWDLDDCSLIFSTSISGSDDVFGPRVTARGKAVSIWPSGGSGRDFYAVLLPEEIEALFPDRAADAGPMVVHLRSRR